MLPSRCIARLNIVFILSLIRFSASGVPRIRLVPVSDVYHISVLNARTKRNGLPLERIGFMQTHRQFARLCINISAFKAWLNSGALPSKPVLKLLEGLMCRR
ncbi:MAG: 30S ribosomal protein S16 [Candidatus Hodgkinia cicadicola]